MNINLNNSLINIDADIIGIIGSSGKYKIAYLSFVSYQNIANQINSQMKKGSFNSAYYGEITFLDKKCYDIYRYRDEKTEMCIRDRRGNVQTIHFSILKIYLNYK